MVSKASRDLQLRFGLEAFVLGRNWLIQGRKKEYSVGQFYLELDEMHSLVQFETSEQLSRAMENESKTGSSEKIRKRYEPYLEEIKSKYKISFSFQGKKMDKLENRMSTVFSISKQILNDIALHYSDASLKIVLENWEDQSHLPYFLIHLRYAIQFGFPIEFKYRKLMDLKWQSRKVIPYLLTLTENNLGIIGKDSKDQATKSFLLSRIKPKDSDFLDDLRFSVSNGKPIISFDYQNYLENDPKAKFQRKEITYRVRMATNNWDLLRHSVDWKLKLIQEESGCAIVEITTNNEWGVFDMLFNYGIYAKLLEPKDALERFRSKVSDLTELYRKK